MITQFLNEFIQKLRHGKHVYIRKVKKEEKTHALQKTRYKNEDNNEEMNEDKNQK